MTEAKTEDRQVCPRCAGTGEIPTCRHVKGGVCFKCWGTGLNLDAELNDARRKLNDARRRWVQMNRRFKRSAPGSVAADTCAQALENIEVEGKKAAKLVERLIADRVRLAAQFKN